MELNDLIPLKSIPNGDCKWIVKNNYLMFKKYNLIPVAYIRENIVYVILDNKIRREIVILTKKLVNMGVEFYFTIPQVTDPSGVEDLANKIIKHCLYSYAQIEFYRAFDVIEFDFIKKLVDWASKFGYYDLIKENYDDILEKVNYKSYNWFSNKDLYEYDEEIRERFQSLYREIQINQLI
jgi:hypothetical protein